jgi:hypothetical protein
MQTFITAPDRHIERALDDCQRELPDDELEILNY